MEKLEMREKVSETVRFYGKKCLKYNELCPELVETNRILADIYEEIEKMENPHPQWIGESPDKVISLKWACFEDTRAIILSLLKE